MSWTIQFLEGFQDDYASASKKVQKAYTKSVKKRLEEDPTNHNDSAIKKLDGWESIWRYRIADEYRLIYRTDIKDKTVTLMLLGHRDKIYERLGHTDGKGPTYEIISDEDLGHVLEKVPDEEQRKKAKLLADNIEKPGVPSGDKDESLPIPLTEEKMNDLGISDKYHSDIQECKTAGDLLELGSKDVPDEIIEKILNYFWPPKLKERLSKPIRMAEDENSFDNILSGKKSLEDFLLALDKTQKPFVNRFKQLKQEDLVGPWLVKGGPGTGKSTVALYCIKELAKYTRPMPLYNNEPTRILFTTYTNALKNASAQLMNHLGINKNDVSITISNINQVAHMRLDENWKSRRVILADSKEGQQYLSNSISSTELGKKYFSMSDREFLMEEIEECIIGEDLSSFEVYRDHDRVGRGKALNPNQRKAIWEIYTDFNQTLLKKKKCLFTHHYQAASKVVNGEYDFVFIDEAQDLKPVAIRLCTKLAKDTNHVFLTADLNQSIYGNGFSWKKVAEGLDFRGKAVNLKMNYRSTKEIWNGILPILKGINGADEETLEEDTFRLGELPTRMLTERNFEIEKIAEWITEALLTEKLSPSCAAILCPSNRECDLIAYKLPKNLNAVAMKSREFNLDHPGVKVMTYHASKGLQFPVVAVTGLKDGTFPRRATGGRDPKEVEEKQRRVFFVACSRAMNRLLVVGDSVKPSRFLNYLPNDKWEDFD